MSYNENLALHVRNHEGGYPDQLWAGTGVLKLAVVEPATPHFLGETVSLPAFGERHVMALVDPATRMGNTVRDKIPHKLVRGLSHYF